MPIAPSLLLALNPSMIRRDYDNWGRNWELNGELRLNIGELRLIMRSRGETSCWHHGYQANPRWISMSNVPSSRSSSISSDDSLQSELGIGTGSEESTRTILDGRSRKLRILSWLFQAP